MQDIRSISSQEPCPVLEATQTATGSLQSLYDSVVPKAFVFSHADPAVQLSKSSHNPLVSMHATQM